MSSNHYTRSVSRILGPHSVSQGCYYILYNMERDCTSVSKEQWFPTITSELWKA